jgi:hypothetical protein
MMYQLGFSQNDSLRKEISSFQDTANQYIGKARGLLLVKFEERDFKAVLELKNYLQSLESKDYISLYPMERWLLDYTMNEYDDVLQTVLNNDSAYYTSFNYRVRPAYDLLAKKLEEFSSDNASKLEQSIENSNRTREDKEFLKLNLHYIILTTQKPPYFRDDLNKMANTFLSSYPQSKYGAYTREYIRYEFGPTDYGFGINLGIGARLNDGNIKRTIDDGVVFCLGFVVTSPKWDYDLRFLVGPVRLLKDIPVQGKTWTKGSGGNYMNFEFSVAHNLLNSKKHKLAPSLGLGLTEFSPIQDSINNNSYYQDIKVDLFSVILGVNYQFKYLIKSRGPGDHFNNFFGCINVRYAISWQPTSNPLYQGFINYITVAWQFEGHGIRKL